MVNLGSGQKPQCNVKPKAQPRYAEDFKWVRTPGLSRKMLFVNGHYQ
jgi:hypothetical protein